MSSSSTIGAGAAPAGMEGGHFNQITQRWELPSDRPEIPASQAASTMPDADGTIEDKLSFKDHVNAYSKKFAGKVFGKEHEVVLGNSLQEGRGKDQALADAEIVKERNA